MLQRPQACGCANADFRQVNSYRRVATHIKSLQTHYNIDGRLRQLFENIISGNLLAKIIYEYRWINFDSGPTKISRVGKVSIQDYISHFQ